MVMDYMQLIITQFFRLFSLEKFENIKLYVHIISMFNFKLCIFTAQLASVASCCLSLFISSNYFTQTVAIPSPPLKNNKHNNNKRSKSNVGSRVLNPDYCSVSLLLEQIDFLGR